MSTDQKLQRRLDRLLSIAALFGFAWSVAFLADRSSGWHLVFFAAAAASIGLAWTIRCPSCRYPVFYDRDGRVRFAKVAGFLPGMTRGWRYQVSAGSECSRCGASLP